MGLEGLIENGCISENVEPHDLFFGKLRQPGKASEFYGNFIIVGDFSYC